MPELQGATTRGNGRLRVACARQPLLVPPFAQPLHLPCDRPQLLAHPRDHLAHEPESEERDARDHEHHDQIEQRPEADVWRSEPQVERHRADEETEREQERAGHTEEQHRLAAEAQLKPDRQEIEHSDRYARQAELRLPRPPGMERHRALGEAEPLCRRDHDHEAVPVGPGRQGVHHLAAVRLHRVEVGDPYTEEPAAHQVVDARDETLLVVSLLRARHDVGAVLDDRGDECGDVGREVLQVGGIEHEHPAARGIGAGFECVGNAPLCAVRHHAHERMLGGELGEHARRAVLAAVVHDHQLTGVGQRQQRLARQPYELGEVLGLVLGGDEHADLGERRIGREAHMRLRIRAGRMPSWSRYLATVRRAIFTPRCSNIWTICWSVSGSFGFSSPTIFWIWALIDRALASSPVVVVRPLEKKNLSGSRPRGVWTYFSLVTRLTVLSCMLMTSATSRSVRGFRYSIPFSKKSRCPSTMKFITLSIVWRRCSIAWIIQ